MLLSRHALVISFLSLTTAAAIIKDGTSNPSPPIEIPSPLQPRQWKVLPIELCREFNYIDCIQSSQIHGTCYMLDQDIFNGPKGLSSIRFDSSIYCILFKDVHCQGPAIVIPVSNPDLRIPDGEGTWDNKAASVACFYGSVPGEV